MNAVNFISAAVRSFCGGKPSLFHFSGPEAYENLVWETEEFAKPTEAMVLGKIAEMQASYEAAEYQRKRAAEYPPMSDYLDGVVKGDQAQMDAYVAACLAVKAKYPKEQA